MKVRFYSSLSPAGPLQSVAARPLTKRMMRQDSYDFSLFQIPKYPVLEQLSSEAWRDEGGWNANQAMDELCSNA